MSMTEEKTIAKLREKNASMGRELASVKHKFSVALTELYAVRAAGGKRAPMPLTKARKIAFKYASTEMELIEFVREIEAYHEII